VQAYISAQLTLGELVVGTVFQDIKCTVDSQVQPGCTNPLTLPLPLTLSLTPWIARQAYSPPAHLLTPYTHPLHSPPTLTPYTHPLPTLTPTYTIPTYTRPYLLYQADRVGIDTVLKSSSEGQGTLAGPGGTGEDVSLEPV